MAADGTQLWVSRYNSRASGGDGATSVIASPDGSMVFVTGTSATSTGTEDYATVAYDAATGAQLWLRRYAGTGGINSAIAAGISPDGKTVFVTGTSQGNYLDYATVAYDAATGTELWEARYNGLGYEEASSLAVSPAGNIVVVTGSTEVPDGNTTSWATVAYDAATGAQMWGYTYYGPHAAPRAVTVGPHGHTVFVTGWSDSHAVTVAYDAAAGRQLWASSYHGPERGPAGRAAAFALAVSPGGGTVYITGSSGSDYGTVAYNAATGAQRWAKRYAGPDPGASASSIAIGPGGHTVYVTGASNGGSTKTDYATVAYNAGTGAQRWASRYSGPAGRADIAHALAVSPGGHTIYVTGESPGTTNGISSVDYATVAYNAATGTQRWARRYNGPAHGSDQAFSAAVNPISGTVFVTGQSYGGTRSTSDYATIAYAG